MVRFAFLLFAVSFSSCVVTVDQIIPESEATFEPGLIGTWEDDEDRITVQRTKGPTYLVSYTKNERVDQFEARLGTLGGRAILDVWPKPQKGDFPEAYDGLLIPGHLVFAIEIAPDEVHLAPIEPDSMAAAIDSGRVGLSYTETEGQFILHGNTEELRSELDSFLARPEGYAEAAVWKRVKD